MEDLFGTPAAPRDPHLAEPLMSAMMIYYRALGDSYRDEEAQAAAVLYVLTWRSLASRKSRGESASCGVDVFLRFSAYRHA